jgi:hypothetical protein
MSNRRVKWVGSTVIHKATFSLLTKRLQLRRGPPHGKNPYSEPPAVGYCFRRNFIPRRPKLR